LIEKYPAGSKILSIGAGPCDFEALLSTIGYKITAIDDLKDQWHLIGKNRQRISKFTSDFNINLIVEPAGKNILEQNDFDVVLIIGIIAHLHNSPRELMNYGMSLLKPGGMIILETANAVSLFNRIKVLFGKNNYVNCSYFYWNVGDVRSHIREYTKAEMVDIMRNHFVDNIHVNMIDSIDLRSVQDLKNFNQNLNNILLFLYKCCTIYPTFKNSIIISGKKPNNWKKTEISIKKFKKLNYQIQTYNLDLEDDEIIIQKIIDS
jgi:2-polyprenyl-3-methyl-5-hydroxy-6-metoxy-1,4-benzoquinol methylase